MVIDFIDKIDPIAIYAAALSTILAGFEIFKFFSRGAKLSLSINESVNLVSTAGLGNNKYMAVYVSNIGDSDTTITNIVFYVYELSILRYLGIHLRSGFIGPIGTDGVGDMIPKVISPGHNAQFLITHSEDLINITKNKIIRIGVMYANSKKPVMRTIDSTKITDGN